MIIPLLLAAALGAAQPAPPTPPPPSDDIRTHQETTGLDFTYAWPRAAQNVAPLRAELQRRQARARREATVCRPSRDIRCDNPYSYEQEWTLLGRSQHLVSLVSLVATFEGGAHGTAGFDGLLWDTRRGRAVTAASLFGAGRFPASFRARYCAALDAIRRERRGPVTDRTDQFEQCVQLGEAVILPKDSDNDGRFDTLSVLLSPYSAGPWAEGTYEPDVPLTSGDLGAIRPELRGDFAVLTRR